MNNKEFLKGQLIDSLNEKLAPLGFTFYKSKSYFKKCINLSTTIYFNLIINSHFRSFNINIFVGANYRDIENALMELNVRTRPLQRGELLIGSLLHFLFPYRDFPLMDYDFSCLDSDAVNKEKRQKIMRWVEMYALPYFNILCTPDLMIEDQIKRDKGGGIYNQDNENIVPVMYWVWKHDKQAALDYLEEKRLRLLKRVKTEEWELVERFKSGERFGEKNPFNALTYNEFMTFSTRFKEWVEEQDY